MNKKNRKGKSFFHFSKAKALICFVLAMIMIAIQLPNIASAELGLFGSEQSNSVKNESNDETSPEGLELPSDDIQVEKYNVCFYDAEGALFQEEQVQADKNITAPTTVPEAPAGTHFIGWFEKDETEAFDFDKHIIDKDLHLFAVFEADEAESANENANLSESESVPDEMSTFSAAGMMPRGPSTNHTVVFEVNGSIYRTLSVIHETLVTLPPDPSSAGGAFVGWYTQSGDPFNPHQLIENDMTLIAKFSDSAVLVTYMNTDGTVLEVLEGQIGLALPTSTKSLLLGTGKMLDYWALQGTTTPFTGSLTGNVTLDPILADMSMVIYITNGSEVDPETGAPGFTATLPTPPTRKGYTFNGWTKNSDGTGSFNFSTPINGIVYLYAKWTPASTTYTLNIWVEKPDIISPGDPLLGGRSDYAIQYTKLKTGTTGDTITFSDTTARAEAGSASTEVQKLLVYSNFKASETAVLASNGDTVINVFFTRTVFTFVFNVTRTSGGAPLSGGEIFLKDGTSKGANYTITVKLDQTVSDIWPAKVNLTGTNFGNWSGYYGLGTYKINYDAIAVSFSSPNPVPGSYNYNVTTPKRTTHTLYPTVLANPMTETRYYYVELTDAEKNDYLYGSGLPGVNVKTWTSTHAVYGGTRYYKWAMTGGTNNQNTINASNVKNWPGLAINGFEMIVAASNPATAPTTCRTTNFQQLIGTPGVDRDFDLIYYMPRKSYVLTLVTGSGTLSSPGIFTHGVGIYTAPVKYQEPIDTILPSSVNLSGYTFEGWYLDENFDDPYVPGTIMPASALTLYAKYRGNAVSITYNDGQNIITNTYAMNESLTAHELSGTAYATVNKGDLVPGKGIFEGWYYQVGSITPPVMIEFPLGQNLTRSTYVFYAKFTPVTYTVTFAGDEDGDGLATTIYDTASVKTGNNTLARSGYTQLIPLRTGYRFVGWTTTLGGTVVDFTTATVVSGNITVYAIWERILLTVNFETFGGSEIAPVTGLYYGSKVTRPQSPVRDGYRFDGWYKDTSFTTLWDFNNDEVNYSITLYAKWTSTGSNQGSSPSSPSQDPGVISTPPPPSDAYHDGTVLVWPIAPTPSSIITIESENVNDGTSEEMLGTMPKTGNAPSIAVIVLLIGMGASGILLKKNAQK